MHTNPHISLLQFRYQQDELRASAGRPRIEAPTRRRWAARYVRRRKSILPAKNAGALAGSIPARL